MMAARLVLAGKSSHSGRGGGQDHKPGVFPAQQQERERQGNGKKGLIPVPVSG